MFAYQKTPYGVCRKGFKNIILPLSGATQNGTIVNTNNANDNNYNIAAL